MDPREEISEDILASTDLVLCEHAPDLRQHIVHIRAAGPSQPADSPGGKFLRARYRMNIPLAAVEAIVACLTKVEQEGGAQAVFDLQPANRVLLIWSFHAHRLRRAK